MSDHRTPEQATADEALTKAIEGVLAAYHEYEENFILTDYIVVTCQRAWTEDGEPLTAIGHIQRDSDVPVHVCLGLLDYATANFRQLAGLGNG